MNQVFLGAVIPYGVILLLYWRRSCRASFSMLIAAPLITVLSALWAVVPDIPRILGMPELYETLARARWTNIFYFHHAIDMVEPDVSGYLYGIAVIALSYMAAAWRELLLEEAH